MGVQEVLVEEGMGHEDGNTGEWKSNEGDAKRYRVVVFHHDRQERVMLTDHNLVCMALPFLSPILSPL